MEAVKGVSDLKLNIVSNNNQTLISLIPPDTQKRTAGVDMCCVIDTSGSMEESAAIKDEKGNKEEFGLCILDIVKHAVKTIINCLSANDRLAIVEFHSTSETVLQLTNMTDEGKTKAIAQLEKLYPKDSTNLWDGLYNGLEILRKQSSPERISSLMILTDGQPNIEPPRGHIPMLLKYKEDNKEFPCQINTFGFGYNLDSLLLNNIAVESQGTYSFIPDSSFVGTVFVNSMSNVLSTYATHVQLFIEPQNQTVLPNNAVKGGHKYVSASWGIVLDVGSLNFGQPKDFIVSTQIPQNLDPAQPYMSAKAVYRIVDQKENKEVVQNGTQKDNSFEIVKHNARVQVVEQIKTSMEQMKNNQLKDAQKGISNLSKDIKSSQVTVEKYLTDLLQDINGQITEAFSREDWYNKWGRHYLPSLACAHQLQLCNNFKDPGVQGYGGQLFKTLRDQADSIFLKIPPPKPTQQVYNERGQQVQPKQVKMHKFYNQCGSCFHGNCTVTMANNSQKLVKDLKKGDQIKAGNGSVATIICILKTVYQSGRADLISLNGGLLITPWHPIRINNKWEFPIHIGEGVDCECDAVYSFLLDSQHSMIINGVECVCLAHGFKGSVVEHEYFGSAKIVEDMKKLVGWDQGMISLLYGSCIQKDSKTGLTVKIYQDNQILQQI